MEATAKKRVRKGVTATVEQTAMENDVVTLRAAVRAKPSKPRKSRAKVATVEGPAVEAPAVVLEIPATPVIPTDKCVCGAEVTMENRYHHLIGHGMSGAKVAHFGIAPYFTPVSEGDARRLRNSLLPDLAPQLIRSRKTA